MTPGKIVLVALALACTLSCGRSSPTDATQTCRNYPRALEENGALFTCELNQGGTVVLACSLGAETRRWEYASLADFVEEASVLHRARWNTRTTTSGVLLGSFASTVRVLEFDPQGRLSRRVRTTSSQLGTFVLDDTVYSRWDGRGRPTRGEVTSGDLSDAVVLTYDDAVRRVESSLGEHLVVDANGNPVDEVEVFGLGQDPFRRERTYRTTETVRLCLP